MHQLALCNVSVSVFFFCLHCVRLRIVYIVRLIIRTPFRLVLDRRFRGLLTGRDLMIEGAGKSRDLLRLPPSQLDPSKISLEPSQWNAPISTADTGCTARKTLVPLQLTAYLRGF